MAEALLSLKEIEHLGETKCGKLASRRDHLIKHLLCRTEQRLRIKPKDEDVRNRVRGIRTDVASKYFSVNGDTSEQVRLQNDAAAADLAQDLLSYPECYLQADQVTDTRIVETIQRMQETLLGRADHSIPLRAVMQCGEAIVVPSERAPRGQPDPLLDQLRDRLSSMIATLSLEARRIADT